jgi:hypothetical protein
MECIICEDWAEHFLECDGCDVSVCEDCAIFDDLSDRVYCAESCQDS